MSSRGIPYARRSGWLSRAIISGFVATVVMLVAVIVAYGIGLLLADLDLADRRGSATIVSWFHGLTSNPIVDFARTTFYAALAVHIAVGLLWAVAYGYFAEPWLGGPGWRRGALFSFIPWVLSLVVFLPVVGGGFLGLALGAGPLPIVGNLIAHVVYGATLGFVYGPFGDVVLDGSGGQGSEEETRAMLSAEQMAARGILVGIVAGAGVSMLAGLLSPASPGQKLLDMPLAAFIVASGLIGGALGGVVGSLVGLTASSRKS